MIKDDIVSLITRIRENINYIENGEAQTIYLNLIENDFNSLLEILKLFIISNHDIYYGCFLMNTSFPVNFSSSDPIAIKIEDFKVLLEVNPLILCKYKIKEIIYLICHEIDHIIQGHIQEREKISKNNSEDELKKFDIVADTLINDNLDFIAEESDNSWLSPPEKHWNSEAIAKQFNIKVVDKGEEFDYYMQMLSDVDLNEDNQSGNITSNHSDWNNTDTSNSTDSVICNYLMNSIKMMNDKQRGLLPDKVQSLIDSWNRPPVLPWTRILKNYVGTISASKRKTRTRLNRRQPERFDLSGTMEDKVLKIVVAIDTSLSMTDEIIAKIFTEIFSIVSGKKHDITVIECDAEIQKVYKVKRKKDIPKSVSGRGGTAFTPVINYINERKYYRDALLIYFTDGDGEPEIPKPLVYRTLWVITDKAGQLSVNNSYGRVVSME